MSYALTILWYERQRFLPGILAVAFSALLVAVQTGLLLGMFSFASRLIDRNQADIWLAGPGVESIEAASPIPESYLGRLAIQPEIAHCEIYLQAFRHWTRTDGGSVLCMVVGSRLENESLGALSELTPELRTKLGEPGSIVVDEGDRDQLGIAGVGDRGEISERQVHVVGMVRGLRGFLGANVFCSIATARILLGLPTLQTMYVLARCHNPADAPAVVQRLRSYSDMSVLTRPQFSWSTRLHWISKTKTGFALGYVVAMGLLVGASVTGQTLYAAVASALREYAVLWAQGIPRWHMASLVLAQTFWVGLIGTLLALPAAFVLAQTAEVLGVKVLLPPWLLASTIAINMLLVLVSSLAALRLLRSIEPALLLR